MTLKIVLAGITMNTGETDPFGSTWLATTLTGWESPKGRNATLDYASKDGVALPFNTYAERALTVEGMCKTPDKDAFWASYNHLLGVTAPLNDPFGLTVTENVDKTLKVVRASEPRLTIHPGWFDFMVALTAPDPVKYGEAFSRTAPAGSDVTATNIGNYPSYGMIISTTTAGTVKVRNSVTKQTLTTGKNSVKAGSDFDVQRRTAKNGSVDLYHLLTTTSEWWPLQPGLNVIENLGTAGIKVTFQSGWI